MEYKPKFRRADDSLLRVNRQGPSVQRSVGPDLSFRPAPLLPNPHVSPRQLHLHRSEKQLTDFTVSPVVAQRQALAPMLEGLQLQREILDTAGPGSRRQTLQRHIEDHQASLGAGQLHTGQYEAAVQRQADLQTPAAPLSQRPSTPAQWSQGGQWEVQRVAHPSKPGQTISLREQEQSQHLGLLRTVGTQLGQGFRSDTGPAVQRYAEYGAALAPFQRLGTGTGRAVVTTALMQVPVSQRQALQRAIDDTIQRQQAQETHDRAIIGLHSLQRQLEHLDSQPDQPLMERIQARRGAGNPIPTALRKALELELNHDLSQVRLHDDAEADHLSKKVNALAFTTGQDIFFKAGTFNPNTRSGVELIAHEVTHVKQQAGGQVGKGIDPDAGLEAEARQMGAKIARAAPAAVSQLAPRSAARSAAVAIQRAPATTLTRPKGASPVDKFKKLLQAAAIRTLDANAARILGQQKTYSNTGANVPAWSELRRLAALQVRMDQRWEQLSMRLVSQSQRVGTQTFDRVTTMIQATMGGRGRLSDSADVILGDMRTHLDPLALMGFGVFDSAQAKKQFELQAEQERQRERPLAETLSLITNVEDARDALHARYPAVGILTRNTAAGELAAMPNTAQNNAQLNARVQPEMKKVQQAIAELRAKMVAGDLPVLQMDVLVGEVLGSMTSDADRKQAQAWVGSERTRNQLIDIVLVLATLGLTLASLLVPGSTLLVVAGVGVGGTAVAKGLVDANKQAGVSRTQDLGGTPLSSVSKAKAEEQLFIAWANTILAAAPVVAATTGGLLRVGRATQVMTEARGALTAERAGQTATQAGTTARSGQVAPRVAQTGGMRSARTAGSVNIGGVSEAVSEGRALVNPANRVVSTGKGTFRINRKMVPNNDKIIGQPEAIVHADAAREVYAAELAAAKSDIKSVYLGTQADQVINGSLGKAASVDVVAVTKNGQYVLMEAKGRNITHALEQFAHSGQQLGPKKIVQQTLVISESLQPGFRVVNGQLQELVNAETQLFKPVRINGKNVTVVFTGKR